MVIGDIISIHPHSSYQNICKYAQIKRIGHKWITLYDNESDTTFRVIKFSIQEFWDNNK